MFGAVFLSLGWLMLQLADGELDYMSQGQGMQLKGDFSIAGFFPLHYADEPTSGLPALGRCNEGSANQHGYHLMQAMRFAVEEINNNTGPQPILPGVTLGYQMYDICSISASILGALDLVALQSPDYTNSQRPVGLVGPDSSSNTFTPATLLGAYLVPQISYEASNEMLSNKFRYPSFFRTIPNDKNQVAAMIQLLIRFNWTWIAIIASDNAYGLQGMQTLSQEAPKYGICIAYQGVLPIASDKTQTMKNVVESILRTKVNTIVVFSSKTVVKNFFPFVIEKKVTDKVWLGSEDWVASSLVSGLPGINTIGTVLGVSIKYAAISGYEVFERKVYEASKHTSDKQEASNSSNICLQSTDLYTLARMNFPLEKYDITSSFNVYTAVYALAHALHQALDCDSGECQKRTVYPWELLLWLKEVQFNLGNTSVYFDKSGDPPTGYDIIFWIWRGMNFTLREVGTFSPDPITLTLDTNLIEWHTEDSSTVPPSICSPPCPRGHKKLQTGQHACCFDCEACPPATFLNLSDPTNCQECLPEEWSPESSEQCLNRTVLLLAWDNPLSIALLFFMASCVLMTSSSAIILLINLNTPVAKSAGGRTCLLMLAALTVAAMSSLCHFGQPSPLACILKQPLFIFSFTVCLASITVRALQVVCIFKFASKLPPAYDKWTKNHGPEFTIFLVSVTILLISVLRVAITPPQPSQDLDFYKDSIVIECSNTLSGGSGLELAYVALLSILCFSFSYMGKDLPANYNEAKCVTFSLMVYMISWMSFFTLYLISRGPFTVAAQVFAILFSVLAFLGGYFLPKIYIIVLKPQMNTTAHFQNCIQMYTMSK
ncbi:taste receptor type 1 member 1 [Dicentrarchus labrax]|uniref:Taste receptor, type 1, member 1 n=1 Tax=Dicentrarchus labrax TaxID=13489 RepID=A0A8C4EE44_DICLA|nr:taste receptor type 1 member 1 [Dicentrarchus labrax]